MPRRLFLAIAAFSLLGAGCLKQSPTPPPSKPAPVAKAPAAQTPTDQGDDTAPTLSPAEQLSAALLRFRDLKSFRAKLSLPDAKVAITGTIEVSKPERLRASLNLGDLVTMDIVIAGASSYVRSNTGPWTDISRSSEGRRLSGMVVGLTTGRNSVSSYGIKKDDNVSKSRDNGKNCDLYDAKLKASDGTIKEIFVCVSDDGMVKYVKLQTPDQGQATFDYYDHNQLFLIEKPI